MGWVPKVKGWWRREKGGERSGGGIDHYSTHYIPSVITHTSSCTLLLPLVQTCSVECGPGIQQQEVVCVNSTDKNMPLEDGFCNNGLRPPDEVPCFLRNCPSMYECCIKTDNICASVLEQF